MNRGESESHQDSHEYDCTSQAIENIDGNRVNAEYGFSLGLNPCSIYTVEFKDSRIDNQGVCRKPVSSHIVWRRFEIMVEAVICGVDPNVGHERRIDIATSNGQFGRQSVISIRKADGSEINDGRRERSCIR